MEQLNRVELRGIVGSVRESKVGDRMITRLTVATNFAYKDSEGCAVIETTWHTVSTWSDAPLGIQKGDSVEVIGRIRNQRYMNAAGEDCTCVEIFARNVVKLDKRPKFEE